MILALLLACTGTKPEPEGPAEKPDETGALSVEVSPNPLDLGAQGVSGAATLTVLNHADGDATLLELTSPDEHIGYSVADTVIPAGGALDVEVTWTPDAQGALDETLSVLVLSADAGPVEIAVPVTGQASWPTAALSVADPDFGTVFVGCDREVAATLSNPGTEDLVVSEVGLVTGASFVVLDADGAALSLPLTVAPGEDIPFNLVYTPMDDVGAEDTLRVSSNDPVTPVAELEIYGIGAIEAENSMTFTAGQRAASTVLFAANRIALTGTGGDRFAAALPAFFDALQDADVRYRVSFITANTGVVNGDIPYVDESYTTDEAMYVVSTMVDSDTGDNDYLLDTFTKAIPENRDWLLDDGAEWEDSKLSLIAVNSDIEQSVLAAVVYVNDYTAYKSDPSLISVNAIAGPPPRGCSEAEPSELLASAADESGGVFMTWCETDWTDNLLALATEVIADRVPFALTGEPAAWSLQVWVDGVPTTEGWTYDEASHEVVFDEASYPATGALVRVDYIMATTCDDDAG